MDHSETIDTAGREDRRSLAKETAWSPEFEVFVRRQSARLTKSLALITLDRGLAEDAAQEAFLQLFLHWEEVRRMDAPEAWLYRVGINRCKNYRRTLRRAARLVERLGGSVEEATQADWSWDVDFTAVFQPLPPRQRTAVTLRYLAGLSTAEIAEAMGISEGAVGSHLYKARESLRKVLEAE